MKHLKSQTWPKTILRKIHLYLYYFFEKVLLNGLPWRNRLCKWFLSVCLEILRKCNKMDTESLIIGASCSPKTWVRFPAHIGVTNISNFSSRGIKRRTLVYFPAAQTPKIITLKLYYFHHCLTSYLSVFLAKSHFKLTHLR